MEAEKEIEDHLFLYHYIDKYQEKLGLYGTKPKLTNVDKALGISQHARAINLAKFQNKVLIDFSTHSKMKSDILTRVVKSSIQERAQRMGIQLDEVEGNKDVEIPMHEVMAAIKDNRQFRDYIFETFRRPGETQGEYFKALRREEEEDELLEILRKQPEKLDP